VAEFLSTEWLEDVNRAVSREMPSADLFSGLHALRVVMEMPDGPANLPHALTLTAEPTGFSVALGDHLAADVILRIPYTDAHNLANGQVSSSALLRGGHIKVRGDVNLLIPFVTVLSSLHTPASTD